MFVDESLHINMRQAFDTATISSLRVPSKYSPVFKMYLPIKMS
jgi:hypothetical protein